MTPRQILSALLVFLAVTINEAASAQQLVKPNSGENQALKVGEYRIGPEDVVQISVWKNDALSGTVSVRPDGKISLPLLNDVQAVGLTPAELRDVLVEKLLEYIPAPNVAVIVTDVRSFKISVIGEVANTGRYQLKSWTTVLDVLAMAGGFTEFASRSRIVVFRPEGKTMKRIPFNYNKLVRDGVLASGEQENFYLRPGDIVLVP